MKKFLLFIMYLLIPLNVYAYSDYIYRGGTTLGIEVNANGILIVGFYQIDGKYNNTDLKIGDYIIKVNDDYVYNLNSLSKKIEEYANYGFVTLTYRRDEEEYTTTLQLIEDNGVYKTGLYVKDSIIGIGTLTYVDPETGIFGSLGHEIIESNSNSIVEVKDGTIFRNSITSINKSSIGKAGSKNATYYYETVWGSIYKNTSYGIFGTYSGNYDNLELVEVGNTEDVNIGEASIYTVIDGENIDEFSINITKINETSDTKNITFEITDEKLLESTGGIVQGMSGSPIMQNGKLIGVVTHVIVDNPHTGYGLFITTMLKEGEKNT